MLMPSSTVMGSMSPPPVSIELAGWVHERIAGCQQRANGLSLGPFGLPGDVG